MFLFFTHVKQFQYDSSFGKNGKFYVLAPHTFDVCPAASNLRIDDKPCACNESGVDDVDEPLT